MTRRPLPLTVVDSGAEHASFAPGWDLDRLSAILVAFCEEHEELNDHLADARGEHGQFNTIEIVAPHRPRRDESRTAPMRVWTAPAGIDTSKAGSGEDPAVAKALFVIEAVVAESGLRGEIPHIPGFESPDRGRNAPIMIEVVARDQGPSATLAAAEARAHGSPDVARSRRSLSREAYAIAANALRKARGLLSESRDADTVHAPTNGERP